MAEKADKSADMFGQAQKVRKGVWTETELKYLALVLADEKKQYAVRLETLTLKKSANNQVFEETAKDFDKLLLSDEFQEENECEKNKGKQKNSPLDISPARPRIKYKLLRK